jgi:minor histocompatibility antigen H13
MITVATKLDVPIKLVYQGYSQSSMLGLGDIVIPGIFIGLALRFDLYQYYRRRIKLVPVSLVSEMQTENPGQIERKLETQYRKVKEPFVDPRNQWGDWLWCLPLRGLHRTVANAANLPAPGFPKTYFYASLGGYTVGLGLTLAMLMVFKHGQPALLYLVPCVTGAAWLTGLIRGELKDMWTYTEDGSLDTEDVVVELDAKGQIVKTMMSSRFLSLRLDTALPSRSEPGWTHGPAWI